MFGGGTHQQLTCLSDSQPPSLSAVFFVSCRKRSPKAQAHPLGGPRALPLPPSAHGPKRSCWGVILPPPCLPSSAEPRRLCLSSLSPDVTLSSYPPLFFKNRKSPQAIGDQPDTQGSRFRWGSESRFKTGERGLSRAPTCLLSPSRPAGVPDALTLTLGARLHFGGTPGRQSSGGSGQPPRCEGLVCRWMSRRPQKPESRIGLGS